METTRIAWTDSTFNSWWGCAKVSPACLNCYAETLDKRTGGDHWGHRKTPRTLSAGNWRQPRLWERDHAAFAADHDGRRRRVFCGSVMDWADRRAPEGQRERLWRLIRNTPHLDWQLLTKRAPNIPKYLPPDWGHGYDNVWLGVSVEDRKHGLPRIDVLREIPVKVRFLSVEPLLQDLGRLDLTGIHWVIVGGETGHHARPMSPDWVMSLKEQCDKSGIAFFFKQWGEYAPITTHGLKGYENRHRTYFPAMVRYGKRLSGCLLNGAEYKQWPAAS